MLDDMLNYFASRNCYMWCTVYSTSKLATAIRSIATYFLVYNLFAHSLTPPTAVRCPQAAVILEF